MPHSTNGIHYEVRGDGPTTVVLLPGLGCSIDAWRDVPALISGFRFVLMDLPGHAGSLGAEADGSSLETMARPLIAACDEIGLDRYAIVGLSFGGALAVRIALDRPHQVIAAMAFMPWPASGTESGDPIMATLYDTWGDEDAVERIVQLISVDPSKTSDVLRTMTSGVSESFWRSWYGEGVYTSIASRLTDLTVPTCYVLGGRDAVAPRDRLLADVQAMPNGRLVYLPDVGHLAPYESPRRVAPEIVEFLGRYVEGGRIANNSSIDASPR
ncbi:alpha/beta fold hydrolase [Microbacterium sp. RD1]|uniref:alpha/beta fold hydrolase n=1 Tax=Microbacterium sp. RD1 TaxID=3457313 RepID=UPI003FA5E347